MLPIKLSGKAFSTKNQGTKLHAGYLAFFAFWGINALKLTIRVNHDAPF